MLSATVMIGTLRVNVEIRKSKPPGYLMEA